MDDVVVRFFTHCGVCTARVRGCIRELLKTVLPRRGVRTRVRRLWTESKKSIGRKDSIQKVLIPSCKVVD